jgi:hypothetical protein
MVLSGQFCHHQQSVAGLKGGIKNIQARQAKIFANVG